MKTLDELSEDLVLARMRYQACQMANSYGRTPVEEVLAVRNYRIAENQYYQAKADLEAAVNAAYPIGGIA